MSESLIFIGLAGLAYLLGGIPTGVLFSRRKYGIDVREMGSGNIGATNVTRVFGWYAGVLVLLLDVLKGALPLWIVRNFFPDQPWLLTACALGLVAGHCFSVYLKFRGGKGVATSLGCLLIAAPWAALVAVVTYVIVLLTTKTSGIGSLSAIAATLVYLLVARPPAPLTWLILGMGIIVIYRHRQNIRRLLSRRHEEAPPIREVP